MVKKRNKQRAVICWWKKPYFHSQKGVVKNKTGVTRVLTGHQKKTVEEKKRDNKDQIVRQLQWSLGTSFILSNKKSEVTITFSIIFLLMVPPKARSSLGVGGLGPNSASPFFFSSSALAAAGPLAFISFLHTHTRTHTHKHEICQLV